jgi:enamine deaminase RidA (YjgF/YER057c/UK114 family)
MKLTRPLALLLPALTAFATPAAAQTLERINPPGLSTPRTYSHVVKAGKLLFIAGQVAADEKGNVVGQTMAEQLERVLANLETALKSQGADFSHVAKITIYTTSIAEFTAPEAVAVRAKYIAKQFPASTLVQIERLARPEFKVEIEATAVLP